MKLSKAALIETMRMAIGSQFEVDTVTRTIARNLPLLRGLYRDDQTRFSKDDLEFLQQARSILRVLDEYTELAEDWQELTDADAAGLIDRLLTLKHQLGELACAAEFDGLIKKVSDRAGVLTTAESLARRHAELIAADHPGCPRCDQQMVKRHSSYGEFWGCARFPKCWGRRTV